MPLKGTPVLQWLDDWLSAFFEVLFGVFGIVVTAGLMALAGYACWQWLRK